MDRELYDQIVKERPYLWWWVQNKENLSLGSVVQSVLANGDMDNVERVFQLKRYFPPILIPNCSGSNYAILAT